MKVKIKTWEDLEKCALYVDEYEDLVMPETVWFTSEMEYKLPMDRVIEVKDTPNGIYWFVEGMGFYITEDMIEMYLDSEDSELDEKEDLPHDCESQDREDYIQLLEHELNCMIEFLESLGHNGEQISEIALTGKYNQD